MSIEHVCGHWTNCILVDDSHQYYSTLYCSVYAVQTAKNSKETTHQQINNMKICNAIFVRSKKQYEIVPKIEFDINSSGITDCGGSPLCVGSFEALDANVDDVQLKSYLEHNITWIHSNMLHISRINFNISIFVYTNTHTFYINTKFCHNCVCVWVCWAH